MGSPASSLATTRLELRPITARIASGLVQADVASLERQLSARFARPFALPPLLDEDVAQFAAGLQEHPELSGWWGWLVVAAGDRSLVGFAMCTWPGEDGATLLGWSVYPHAQGRGYATEAMLAILGWAFADPRVRLARATIPPALGPSLRVARKLGMREIGIQPNAETGSVRVYELDRESWQHGLRTALRSKPVSGSEASAE